MIFETGDVGLKLPFGRSGGGDDDPFGDPLDGDERPSFFGSLFRKGPSADEGSFDIEEDEAATRRRWIALIVLLVGLGLGGAFFGYRMYVANLRQEEAERAFLPGPLPTAAPEAAPAPPPPPPPPPPAATSPSSGKVVMAMPPRPTGASTGALVSPPGGDVAASDRSASRRPWLTGGGESGSTPAPAPAPATAPAPTAPVAPAAPAASPAIAPPTLTTPPAAPPAATASPAPPAAPAAAPRAAGGEPLAPSPFEANGQKPPRFEELPVPPKVEPLPPAPMPDLTAKTSQGLLPVVGAEGRSSASVYARPFDGDIGKPRIALVVTDLGLRRESTEAAIDRLPAAVTLAFSPYAQNLKHWADRARAKGHEVMIGLPMEPTTFPTVDPGPYALLTALSPKDNMARLETVLTRTTGYVGVLATHGSRFLTSHTQVLPILLALRQRGLLYLDNGAVADGGVLTAGGLPGLPFAVASMTIDERPFREAIDARLDQLTAAAMSRKRAVALASAYPLTFERLVRWMGTLEAKGIQIAPVSAVVVTVQPKK
ncbi:MAG: divergent polysaccharide deacetylase family protein [Alphaproteobacteria bacterium]